MSNPVCKTQTQLLNTRQSQRTKEVKDFKVTVKKISDFDSKIEDRENSLYRK